MVTWPGGQQAWWQEVSPKGRKSWAWEVGASQRRRALASLPPPLPPSSASPSLPESSTAAAHTSKLIKAKGLINRRIEHFSRYADFCGFSANLTLEPQAASSPPAPSPPAPAVLPPPSTHPGHPLCAGRGTQPCPTMGVKAGTLQA